MATFKGLVKKCEVCGAEFKVPQSQAHVRTCSVGCGYQIRRSANKKEKVEIKCKHCGDSFFTFPSHEDRRKYCSTKCQLTDPEFLKAKSKAIAGNKNPAWRGGVRYSTSKSGKVYSRLPAHIENEKGVRRKRAIGKATPIWADLDKVRDIYLSAQAVSKLTGIAHHVDHQVPLTSSKVCGLHNEFNLMVMPGADNLRKSNRTWPDM